MRADARRAFPIVVATLVLVTVACTGDGKAASRNTSAQPTAAATTTTVAPRPSSGCNASTQPAPASGDEKVTLQSGGTERYYFRHQPRAAGGATPMPLVVDLHGYAEAAVIHRTMSALGPFGDTHGFITITPQGTGKVAHWDTGLNSADMTFISDAMDNAERTLCVDTARVFVTGLSNGAMMASAVACALSDRVAAVAPVAGVSKIENCAATRPVPVVAFHGTADQLVAFAGGYGPGVASIPSPDSPGRTFEDVGVGRGIDRDPAIPAVMADWAKRNGCNAKPTTTHVASDVALISYRCPSGADVELYRVNKGGHSWPGSAFSKAIATVIGPTTFSINADEVMWKFFEEHPLKG